MNTDADVEVKAADSQVILLASAPSLARPSVVNASTVARRGNYAIHPHIENDKMLTTPSHSKSECTKPRVFKGACRICNVEGHPASECPDKPADVCKNCKSEGNIGKWMSRHVSLY